MASSPSSRTPEPKTTMDKRHSTGLLRSAVVALLLSALALVTPQHLAAQPALFSGAVARVTDGDTFRLQGIDKAIRVWGLDAPERKDPGGPAATSAMRDLITGQTLTCRQRDIDRYGRIVGQCFLPDGRDIAAEMIRMGVATEYCRYSGGYYQTC